MNELVGIGRMPGTCGELVQGTLDGVPFHVTCPIDIYSTAEVRLSSGEALIFPPSCAKAGKAARRALESIGQPKLGGSLSLSSTLPRSKGMASSTADIGAAILAVARALQTTIDSQQIAGIALGVEPTDGSILPGIVLFDHRSGKIYEHLGPPPPIDVIVLDFGGEVDTIAFNQHDRSALLASLEPQTNEALSLVQAGIALGDPLLVGRGATLSSLANQEVLYKPQLETIIAVAEKIGAVGVNVGHSGTVIGVLMDRRKGDTKAAYRFLLQWLVGVERSFVCAVVGGGPPIESPLSEAPVRRTVP